VPASCLPRSRSSGKSASHGFSYPVSAPITSPYGMRFHPILKYWKLHDGTDFGASCGQSIRAPYSGKVVGVAYACGAVTHLLLFMGYGLYKAGVFGNAGLLVYAAVIGFTPIILATIASRFFKPELLRPVPTQ